jgi:zinc/manganese transport system substrate-binding protein
VHTIIEGSSGDPHDFEPTPADIRLIGQARLVVMNGLGYDTWAAKAVDAAGRRPGVVDAGKVVGLDVGANPHLWYCPDCVVAVGRAVTAALKDEAPSAASYFEDRAAVWDRSLTPYQDQVAAVRAEAAGRTYAATESVFDDMAEVVGLRDVTPEGYRNAAANESDPAPGDVDAFERELRSRAVDVLIFNTQTEGAVPDQLRTAAEAAGVPVVEVTETVKPGTSGFVDWQVAQLRALADALR